MELSGAQFKILTALVELYEEKGRPVKSSELAGRIGRSSGTVRNTIAALKALGLVESKTGPLGGYVPTSKSLELVEKGSWGLREPLRLEVGGAETGVRVVDIKLIDLPGSPGARAILRVAGRRWLYMLEKGSHVRLGPTPYTRLVLAGRVFSVDRARCEVVVDVDVLTAIPRVSVDEIMSSRLVSVGVGATVEEVAGILLQHNIRAVPVVDGEGRLCGLATARRVFSAALRGRGKEGVCNVVEKKVFTARPEEDILDLMKSMEKLGIGRVVVVGEDDRPVGIVTRTDILGALTAAYRGFRGKRV